MEVEQKQFGIKSPSVAKEDEMPDQAAASGKVGGRWHRQNQQSYVSYVSNNDQRGAEAELPFHDDQFKILYYLCIICLGDKKV